MAILCVHDARHKNLFGPYKFARVSIRSFILIRSGWAPNADSGVGGGLSFPLPHTSRRTLRQRNRAIFPISLSPIARPALAKPSLLRVPRVRNSINRYSARWIRFAKRVAFAQIFTSGSRFPRRPTCGSAWSRSWRYVPGNTCARAFLLRSSLNGEL